MSERLAAKMAAFGFRVRCWKSRRVYVQGYGRDVTAYIEPSDASATTADASRIIVSSNWRSPHAGLRCKGIKHALLRDLYAVGLLSERPPDDWKQVSLDDPPRLPI